MKTIIDGVEVIRTRKIKNGNETYLIWETDLVLSDGDALIVYEIRNERNKFKSICFNPFNGISTNDICITDLTIREAADCVGVEVDIFDEFLPIKVAIKLAKKILSK
jgi:hypothetical protein